MVSSSHVDRIIPGIILFKTKIVSLRNNRLFGDFLKPLSHKHFKQHATIRNPRLWFCKNTKLVVSASLFLLKFILKWHTILLNTFHFDKSNTEEGFKNENFFLCMIFTPPFPSLLKWLAPRPNVNVKKWTNAFFRIYFTHRVKAKA